MKNTENKKTENFPQKIWKHQNNDPKIRFYQVRAWKLADLPTERLPKVSSPYMVDFIIS